MNKYKNIDDIIANFGEAIISASSGAGDIHEPFDLTPVEYLSFAKDDLVNGNEPRHLINAVGNTKRAIECRLDAVIDFWGMTAVAEDERYNFPKKLELLEDMGIIAPNILRKINKHRNETEHDYTLPTYDVVRDFCDVAELFIGYTEKFIRTDVDCQIEDIYDELGDFLNLKFDRESSKFTLGVIEFVDGGNGMKRTAKKYEIVSSVRSNKDDYIKFIRWWYDLMDR